MVGRGRRRTLHTGLMKDPDLVILKLDLVYDVDIRQPSIHRQDFQWVTDYLIGCHNNSVIPPERDNDLCIFAGSNEYVLAF